MMDGCAWRDKKVVLGRARLRGCLVLGEKVLCSPNQSRGMAAILKPHLHILLYTVLGLIRHVNDLKVDCALGDYLMENETLKS